MSRVEVVVGLHRLSDARAGCFHGKDIETSCDEKLKMIALV